MTLMTNTYPGLPRPAQVFRMVPTHMYSMRSIFVPLQYRISAADLLPNSL